jgi:NADPH2:quinone reductase
MVMRAVLVQAYGSADVLRVTDTAIPEPGPGCARIKIEAIGVNFVDVYYRSGQYPSDLPLIPGMEAAGLIDALGPELSDQSGGSAPRLTVGTRVAYAMLLGSYAEYVVAPVNRLVPVPEALSSEQAAAAALQGMTAHFLSYDCYPFSSGDTALVHAAAGGLGQLLTQLLADRGVRVIGVVSSEPKADVARKAGAEEVIVRERTDFVKEVSRLTGGTGIGVVYDSVGQDTWRGSLACTRPRGHLVLCGQASGPVPPIDPQLLRSAGSIWLSRPSLTHFIADRDELLGRAADIYSWVAAGDLRVRIEDVLDLNQAATAHRRLEERGTTGKLLLVP